MKNVAPSQPILSRVFGRAKKDYARLSPEPENFEVMRKAMMEMMATQPNYDAAQLASIRTRVTIAVGEHDEFIKPEHTDYLVRTIRGARKIVLPAVSHFAMLQRPDEFNRAMLDFLTGKPQRS